MSELGTRLREARVNKGYTLNTLQQMTKIQKKYLQALEEGNYEEVPGNFYVRAFVKQYADMVGLDGDLLLREYADELEFLNAQDKRTQAPADQPLPSRVAMRHSGERDNRLEMILSYIPLFILTVIILLIIVILAFAIRKANQGDVDSDNQAVTVATSIVESVEPSSLVEDSNQDESDQTEKTTTTQEMMEGMERVGDAMIRLVSEPGSLKTYELQEDPDQYTFALEADAFVWFGVYEDGVMVVDQAVNAGEKFEYTPSKQAQEIRLDMGYPQGGKYSVNGKTLQVDSAVPLSLKFVRTSGEDSQSTTKESLDLEETTTTGYQGPAVYAPESGN